MITREIDYLQQQMTLVEAIEERNKAQLDSFVDEEDQWESMDEEEQELLSNKSKFEDRLEKLTSELVNMWMGGKAMEG